MRKSTISKLFIGGVLAIAGGIVVLFAGVWLGYANGAFVMSGPNLVGVQPNSATLTLVVTAVIGSLSIAGGALAQLCAWIAAVMNTARLQDKTWFLALLLLGLVSFGFVAMLCYLIAGPDSTAAAAAAAGIRQPTWGHGASSATSTA